MTLQRTLEQIKPASEPAWQRARERWSAVAKPLEGLGLLEEAVCRAAAALGTDNVALDRKVLCVFCADNGVVAEGVSQSGSEVTGAVVRNLCRGTASVSRMAAAAGCRVIPIDMGMREKIVHPLLRQCSVAPGSGNIAKGPAMARESAVQAVETGISLAEECAASGFRLLAAGEIGMGNTTTASAVTAALLQLPARAVTGPGAGLSPQGLARKILAIEKAIGVNRPNSRDPLDVLAKLGGFDIAAMCGFYLGAAANRLPVVLDGVISGVAALCAARLCPWSTGYLLASHASAEPAAKLLLEALELRPLLYGNFHLGEGSGAVALMPLLDLSLAVYHTGATFEECMLDAYLPQV